MSGRHLISRESQPPQGEEGQGKASAGEQIPIGPCKEWEKALQASMHQNGRKSAATAVAAVHMHIHHRMHIQDGLFWAYFIRQAPHLSLPHSLSSRFSTVTLPKPPSFVRQNVAKNTHHATKILKAKMKCSRKRKTTHFSA